MEKFFDFGFFLSAGNSLFFPRQSLKRFTFCVKSSDSIFFLFGFLLSSINWTWKVNLLSLSRGKYCLIHLKMVKRPKKLNCNVEILFKTRQCCPLPPHNFILFELDFDVKFPLLRLLQFLSDLKSTILHRTVQCCILNAIS